MEEWMQGIGIALLGAGLASVGFIVRRHLTDAARHEKATLYSILADLKGKMEQQGVSAEELEHFAAQLSPKLRDAEARRLFKSSAEPNSYWTQGAMNGRAWAAYEVENAKLEQAVIELVGLLGDGEGLAKVQEAWELYRDTAAEMVSSEYEGGSIRPLIHSGELTSLTRERLARVQALIGDRRERYG